MADGRKGVAGSRTAEFTPATEGRVEEVIGPLEVVFDAAVARDEEVAADDLAFSLDQDRTLRDVLTRAAAASLVESDGRTLEVSAVGEDYVATAGDRSLLRPLDQAIFSVSRPSRRSERRSDILLDRLRDMARRAALVDVETRVGRFSGRLTRARRDHLQLENRVSTLLIPYGVIASIRVRLGG